MQLPKCSPNVEAHHIEPEEAGLKRVVNDES